MWPTDHINVGPQWNTLRLHNKYVLRSVHSMVCEGLAYMHCTYVAPILSTTDDEDLITTGISDCNLFDVINRVRDDVSLSQLVHDEIVKPEWQSRNISNFQRSVEILLKYRGDKLMELARSIKVPSDMVDTACLARWMVNNAITVYATSEKRNDFFLLHGVTAAWSLLQVWNRRPILLYRLAWSLLEVWNRRPVMLYRLVHGLGCLQVRRAESAGNSDSIIFSRIDLSLTVKM